MTGARYETYPAQWWPRMNPSVRLLDADLAAVEADVSAIKGGATTGSADLPPGVIVALRPNTQGTWAGVLPARSASAVYWWQRPLTTGTNAPIPTWADNYATGDIVSPISGDERLPYRGVLFSESGIVTADNPPMAGRTADNYNGGVERAVWAILAGEGDQARARLLSGTDAGIELYDSPTVYVASPDLDWTATPYRVSLDVKVVAASSYAGGIVIAGDTVQDRAIVAQVAATSTAGQYGWTIQHVGPDNWAPPVTLGTATGPEWARATITVNGNTITITQAGSTFTHTLTGDAADLPKRFALWANLWGLLRARNLTVEAI